MVQDTELTTEEMTVLNGVHRAEMEGKSATEPHSSKGLIERGYITKDQEGRLTLTPKGLETVRKSVTRVVAKEQ
jgi:Mn-dependent DtxR family transcriptional regulator